MNKNIRLCFLVIFCFPVIVFSQAGKWNSLMQQIAQPKSNNQPSVQDTAKPKQTGTQSNLAVADEGTPSSITKNSTEQTDKKTSGNPIQNMKKKLTKSAAPSNGSNGTTSNLAVADEGTPSEKESKGKTNRETTTPAHPNKGNTTTVANPK